jgi:hypothetical protein
MGGITASTATAKAMSVAVGIAQPRIAPSPALWVNATKMTAGSTIPPTAAAIGSAAPAGVSQVPGDELALEFQADDEEDGQQPVGRPAAQRQVQVHAQRSVPTWKLVSAW